MQRRSWSFVPALALAMRAAAANTTSPLPTTSPLTPTTAPPAPTSSAIPASTDKTAAPTIIAPTATVTVVSDPNATLNTTLTFTLGAICGILLVVIVLFFVKRKRERRQGTLGRDAHQLSPSFLSVETPLPARSSYKSTVSTPKVAVLGPSADEFDMDVAAQFEAHPRDLDLHEMDSPYMSDSSSGRRSSSDLGSMDSTRFEEMVRMKINLF
ncbi:hypothetical protein SDRG_06390 [Saprolegnia diclina VS20]|uniref:Gram-positive cocci surface proteins LPxTG domain-containing protein n=1 Tax=Saprolegnia diclina (strain VS20) TaxID=1156394 RepID=T0QQU6_SAPDV|nr:hypothetical protein SDRG_06390 [Saprolegnia diclina VS20]EQC36285.1 hypothetical protein SDRG_06390 [Saprolegnia diclina VS20]|eukprot:XP_008610391.1 hypothetical protein SDRG_06390 [Saprolegnia diclina VS20]